ncbi:MAG: ribonuclease HI [Candidatus Accumulibacter sp.]|jgi:ribonuclease HI|nr:ribonuclease HI [Accumulibacter sp.]
MATKPIITVFADGACRMNPGPGGWGVLLQMGKTEKELWGGEENTTNNRMELTAVIRALEALEALKHSAIVRVYTDSQYVQKGMSEWIYHWKDNGWRTSDKKAVKNADLWQRLDALCDRHAVTWMWVKGHAGDTGNEHADRLANRGIDELLRRSKQTKG